MKLRQRIGDPSAYIFILPSVIILGLYLIYPIIWSFLASFKNIKPLMMQNSGLFEVPGDFAGLSQYITVINNPLFKKALMNTARFGIMFVPFTILASLGLALLLNKNLSGTNYFRAIIFAPYVVSVVSVSLIFMFLFNGDRGLVNAILQLFGIQGPNWLADPFWAMPVIALMTCWRKIGYYMLIYLAGLQNIPKEIYESADIDGANVFQRFRFIIWPLLTRISLVVFVLLLIDSLNILQEIYVMTGGGPGDATLTMPFLIYNEAFKFYKISTAAAMSYILFIIILVITMVRKKVVDKKLA